MDTTHDNTAGASPARRPGGRLVLLTTTHRVAPGLLSWPAWEVLRGADRVLTADAEHPQLAYLRAAGIDVEIAEPSARDLLAAAAGRTVVLLTGADGDPGRADELARVFVGAGEPAPDGRPELELLPGSYDLPGARLLDLVTVMDRLRSPGGCPWDASQTHESLVRYLVEESYELIETIEDGDRKAIREELGDVLLQVMFHARIAAEHPDDPFTIDDVAGGIVDKLIYRHPHVFGSVDATTPAEVADNWEELKATEKQRESATDGVPLGQPALALAAKLAARARGAGLDVPATAPIAVPQVVDAAGVGELLLAVAVLAAAGDVDPESALRAAARSYRDRIRQAETGG